MSIETEGLHIQVHPSPEVILPENRLFTTAEVEEKLQKAYALGWNAAIAKFHEPINTLIDLNHRLVDIQKTTIEMMKGSRYDYWVC